MTYKVIGAHCDPRPWSVTVHRPTYAAALAAKRAFEALGWVVKIQVVLD